MTDVTLTEAGRNVFEQPALRASEITPKQRDKISKAPRVYPLRLYFRLQFELALLRAEWAFLEVCQFLFERAVSAKSFVKDSLCRPEK
jgi:hypothetical protein